MASMSTRFQSLTTVGKAVIFFTLTAGLMAFCGCTLGHNASGANREHATQEAQRYVKSLVQTGVEASLVSCVETDSDGDGYLACNLVIDGQPQTVDCAGAALASQFMVEQHGCKAYMPKIRVNQTVTTGSGGSGSSRSRDR